MGTHALARMARRIFGDTDRASGVPDASCHEQAAPPSLLQEVEGQALADAFGVWDAADQTWLPFAPLLLRFEQTDLLLQPSLDGSRVVAALGAVPTSSPIALGAPETAEQEQLNRELCLQWMRCSDLSGLAGMRALHARFLPLAGGDGSADARANRSFASIEFEDGSALVVRNDGGFLETFLLEGAQTSLLSA